jgi:hypothetical protein
MYKIKEHTLSPMPNKVFVTDLEIGEVTRTSGVIIANDLGKNYGLRDRWAKVYKLGEGVEDISVGEWVYIEHGRWTVGLDMIHEDGTEFKTWMVDWPDACIMTSSEPPTTFFEQITKRA